MRDTQMRMLERQRAKGHVSVATMFLAEEEQLQNLATFLGEKREIIPNEAMRKELQQTLRHAANFVAMHSFQHRRDEIDVSEMPKGRQE